MAKNIFSKDRTKCFMCGEYLKENDESFILQKAKVVKDLETTEKRIFLQKDGQAKFVAHEACQNKVIWKIFHPDIDLEEDYYAYIELRWKNNQPVWKLGKYIIKDDCTKEELNDIIALFAKYLLRGDMK